MTSLTKNARALIYRVLELNLVIISIMTFSACSSKRLLTKNNTTIETQHRNEQIEQKTRQKEHIDSLLVTVNTITKNDTTVIEKIIQRFIKTLVHDTIETIIKDTIYIYRNVENDVEVTKESHTKSYKDVILLLTILIVILWRIKRLKQR